MIGQQIGRYRIESRIGQGAMGEVYRAVDDRGEFVAVKFLMAELAREPVFLMRFQAEIETLRKLRHPNIVSYQDHGIHEGIPFLVMEWIDGPDYESLGKRGERGRLPWQEVLDLALQVVPALRHAHRKGFLHRDLKPSNLLRCLDGRVKLSDFGLAKMLIQPSPQLLNSVVGAIAYTAPEQALGKPITKRSDFYAFGGVLYTLLTGRPPFSGNNVVEVMHKHCFVQPERPEHLVPGLPRELDDLICRLLAKDPAQRPGDGSVLLKQLEQIRAELERRGQLDPNRTARSAVAAHETDDLDDDDSEDAEIDSFRPLPPPPEMPVPLMRRPIVVIPMAATVFLLILWGINRRPSAEMLFAKVEPLLQSDSPDDWQKAWDEGLSEIASRFPDRYLQEVRQVRERLDDRAAIRRAIASYRLNTPSTTEAERLYRRGLSLLATGELAAAQRQWEHVAIAFADVPEAARWVEQATNGIAEVKTLRNERPRRDPESAAGNDIALQAARARLAQLRATGQIDAARAMAQALRVLYADDPIALQALDFEQPGEKSQPNR
ncbi:serine/threonine protein kinase [Tuwongella immobilis]|uniref:Protein kinase domain-containing protein n=1 Tax=Tuwongella immobilis TaxID=692036 RepID=A0A6C2YHU5_9BACT|nr:serine/threonine-protein kinase [Tuwongella immobilis]VIP01108.1 serine threonine protein kinase : Serine/threonine protein kinase-related protein OS=Planctomyces limnophilus (strain ATCC 43296 / DSM 3776 / IFAM 1008 / 290) GN=Plim_3668 PE=3 SV=1: Pkinase [Tuwongella immobilis]VTR97641.1 serine threonine protein kinase : Serine/threonine protein kinase-related protein OS=Planctomyces limnophilus (strain ATCC 43296 / DSM 3776 / IFAM 1008 / 290) GN=Plim_3668 PE=3 SV=1: Pkinase [Tuwongella immobi